MHCSKVDIQGKSLFTHVAATMTQYCKTKCFLWAEEYPSKPKGCASRFAPVTTDVTYQSCNVRSTMTTSFLLQQCENQQQRKLIETF